MGNAKPAGDKKERNMPGAAAHAVGIVERETSAVYKPK
jgi:hypothetical protein